MARTKDQQDDTIAPEVGDAVSEDTTELTVVDDTVNTTDVVPPALAHDDYTPQPGQEFTREMAERFFERYHPEIEQLAELITESTEHKTWSELFTVEMLMSWNQGAPFHRGYSDDLVMVGYVAIVDPDSSEDDIIRLLIEFDSERVFSE